MQKDTIDKLKVLFCLYSYMYVLDVYRVNIRFKYLFDI